MDFGRPLYLDEVAGQFPELKIVAGHCGWPWVNEMMAVLWRHKNVYADIGAIRPRYIGMPGTGWETALRYGNSLLQDKILFATAWLTQGFKESIEEIQALPVKQDVKIKWREGMPRGFSKSESKEGLAGKLVTCQPLPSVVRVLPLARADALPDGLPPLGDIS